MKTSILIMFSIVFLLGFLSANIASFYLISGLEVPFLFWNSSNDDAPFDFIDERDIKVYHDRIVIFIDDASLSKYAPTGSMLPIFDQGANGIRIAPNSEEDIHVGDIISYERAGRLIVHRVVEKGIEEEGDIEEESDEEIEKSEEKIEEDKQDDSNSKTP